MSIKNVDVKTLVEWIEEEKAIIIDVREQIEYAEERIKNSYLLPLSKITKNMLPLANNKKLVIHCRSGARSIKACKKLLSEDSSLEIFNLEGGILAWKSLGNNVIRTKQYFIPLDRQVQLAIGFMILLSSILSYIYSEKWLLFTGFIGTGLIIAGLTGFCSLGMIIAKMPWNKYINNTESCNIK